MRVDTKEGADGVRCWNVEAIAAYAQRSNEREAALTAANPDLVLLEGVFKCYGCEIQEYDYGIKCTAVVTRSRFGIDGEIEPRPEDAKTGLGSVPGLLTRAPDEVAATVAEPEPVEVAPAARGRFRLFGGR